MNPHPHNEPQLLVDIEVGRVLDAPPRTIRSRRWAESHPFVELVDEAKTLLAGPDAKQVASGAGGKEFVEYTLDREVDGYLHLTRVG